MINAPKEMQELYLLFEISQSLFIITNKAMIFWKGATKCFCRGCA